MKKIILFVNILLSLTFFSQNVGINTAEPTRRLDVNGDLRVTKTTDKTGNTDYPNILSANKNTGDIDFIDIGSFLQSDVNNMEVKRNIYIADSPDSNKECSCGDITFRINGTTAPNANTAQFKLNNSTVFSSNNITNFELDYGIKRWTGTAYNYANNSVNFTLSDYSAYKVLDPTVFSTDNTGSLRIYTIILPKQNNLYRITLSRINNSDTAPSRTFSLICERFYLQTL